MDREKYCRSVGSLIINLQSLEFALRAYLYAKSDPPHSPLAAGQALTSFKVGDTVPVNAMTDYSPLGLLIKRYNKLVEQTQAELRVSFSVVEVRDALAHGRISTTDLTKDFDLLKFDKPSVSKTTTTVSYSQTLTAEWFESQNRLVYEELMKVAKAQGAQITRT